MQQSFNSDTKQVIRAKWGLPILSFLRSKLNFKLIYLGLPGVQAYDIHTWLEHIDIVHAFQCREYPLPFNENQSREMVIKLEDNLLELERKQLLKTFDVYDGYVEEVILRGFDNSSPRRDFIQEEIVTIYNLDYCNQITSPINYLDKKGNNQTAYKFDAIRNLLISQEKLSVPSNKFAFFLTIHCSFQGKEFAEYLEPTKNRHPANIKDFIKNVREKEKGHDKNAQLLRLFVIQKLSEQFRTFNFIPHFLPTIFYLGDNGTPLLHFTVLGTKGNIAASTPWLQSLENLINEDFINTANTDLSTLNPVNIFSSSNTYKKHWLKHN